MLSIPGEDFLPSLRQIIEEPKAALAEIGSPRRCHPTAEHRLNELDIVRARTGAYRQCLASGGIAADKVTLCTPRTSISEVVEVAESWLAAEEVHREFGITDKTVYGSTADRVLPASVSARRAGSGPARFVSGYAVATGQLPSHTATPATTDLVAYECRRPDVC